MMNKNNICAACGTYFPLQEDLPKLCPICADDRQYVPETGQEWTSTAYLLENHAIDIKELDSGLYQLRMTPSFSIGQRALLIIAPEGNVLWDCIPLLDPPTIDFINSKGGLKAIAFSHPHFYSNMNDWAHAFDCPIYIHKNDEKWIVNRGDQIRLWSGFEKPLWDDMRLINIGGHFPGSSILEVPFISAKGTLLCGDTFVISPSKKHIAAMNSYPNKIPLPLDEIRRIKQIVGNLRFDAIEGWNDSQSIGSNASSILENSLARYI
ncbi:MAG: MBL fold metallo-hydrolase [Acidobacteria bacterium]|nr:MBL fold metallo-hydrolase [Acidobacteriota bacterium]